MTETPREERLRSALAREAARVTTSPDAWARIERRVDGGGRRVARIALAGAGVAVLAGVVAVAVLGAPTPVTIGPDPAGRSPATTAGSPTAEPTASVRPDATPPPAPALAWSSVRLPDALGTSVEGIASVGDTVLVVGEDGAAGRVAWLSTDGGRSFALERSEDDGGWWDVAAVGADLVAVGSVGGVPAIDVLDPRSGEWTAAYRGDAPGVLYGVADGPEGPVATGNVDAAGGRHGLVVGRQPGGWVPIDAPAMAGRETVLYHVAGGPRGYVATGYGPDEGSIIDTWFSPDGRGWSHLNATPGEGIRSQDGVLDALAVDPDGRFWAVQAGGDVWRSDDGRRWSVTTSLTGGSGPVSFRTAAATAAAGGVVAVAGDDDMGAYWVPPRGEPEELAAVAAESLTVGAGITVVDGTVLVPLSGTDGPFVWRGEPAS